MISTSVEDVCVLEGTISTDDNVVVSKVNVFYDNNQRSARIYIRRIGSKKSMVRNLNSISLDTLLNILHYGLDSEDKICC